MADDTQRGRLHIDADGVRIYESGSVRWRVWLGVLVAGLAGLALLALGRRVVPERDAPTPSTPPVRSTSTSASAADGGHAAGPARAVIVVPPRRPPIVPVVPATQPQPGQPVAAASDQAEPPPHEDPVFGPANPGERTGVALFPPPGTKPIKRGLVVPDDFELPPGYVRHYQATDDGERVPAILMFHPDYHPVDEHGDPIALPADRVVPPELAPPGMPIQMLELPEDQGEQDAAP